MKRMSRKLDMEKSLWERVQGIRDSAWKIAIKITHVVNPR